MPFESMLKVKYKFQFRIWWKSCISLISPLFQCSNRFDTKKIGYKEKKLKESCFSFLPCISLIMECFHIDRHFWSDRLIGQSCRGGFSLAEAAWGCLLIGWSCRGDFLLAKAAGAPSHWLKMLGGANSLAKAPGRALIGQRVCALQCIGYHSFQNDVSTMINNGLMRKRSGRFLVQLNTNVD